MQNTILEQIGKAAKRITPYHASVQGSMAGVNKIIHGYYTSKKTKRKSYSLCDIYDQVFTICTKLLKISQLSFFFQMLALYGHEKSDITYQHSTWFIVIVITFYSPSCLGQETAKGPFGLRVKLPPAPPVYPTRRRLHTVPLFAERQAGKL